MAHVSLTGGMPRRGAGRSSGASGGLVGRELELRVLEHAMGGLGRGVGSSVLVSGEPGIGKTRLLHAAAEVANRQGANIAWGHMLPDAAPALWPWVQVLRRLAADLASGEPVAAGRGTRHLVSLVPELSHVLAEHDCQDNDGAVEHAGFYLRDAMAAVLLGAARRRPQVVVLDDLHWADVSSLRLAERVVSAARGEPLCLLAAMRNETPSDEHTAALARLRMKSDELVLEGLAPEECRELALERLERFRGRVSAPDDRYAPPEALFERTAGNPLFIEGVLKSDAARLPGAVTEPARVVLMEWLEGLSAAEHDLVAVASVAHRSPGLSLSPKLLARAAATAETAAAGGVRGTGIADQAMAALVALVDADILQLRSDGTLGFRHGLVAEAAYEWIDPRRRAGLHLAWATTLIEAWPRAVEQPDVIAGHLLGGLPDADPYRARRWAVRAAAAATERRAHDEAAGWYEAALETLPPDGRAEHDEMVERCDLLLALGRARLQDGGTVRASAAFEEAVAAAERARDHERRLDALVWLTEARFRASGSHLRGGAGEAVRGTLTAAIEEASDVSPSVLARAVEQLARLETFCGTSERARAVAEQALGTEQQADNTEAAVAARRALRWALAGPFPMDDKHLATRNLVGAMGRWSHPAEWWIAHSWTLVDALQQGDRSSVDAALQSCRRLANQLQEPYLGSLTSTWEAAAALLEGRYDEAEQMIGSASAIAEGCGLDTGALRLQRACLAWQRGESASSIDLLYSAADPMPGRPPLERAMLAGLLGEHRRVEEATFELERLAVDSFGHISRDASWLATLAWCATAAVQLNLPEIAGSMRPLLVPFRDRGIVAGGLPHLFLGAVAHYTGALAVTAGDPGTALDDLADALTFHERLRARPWVARTLLEQGRAYLARGAAGDTERAATALATVRREAAALGMAGLEERARGLAAKSPPAPRPTLARQGDSWQVAFTGAPFHLRDSKGLRSLCHLLARPGVKVPATTLVTDVLGDPAVDPERARVNVTRQLRAAVDRIGEHEPALRAHLRSAVTTGRGCCYRPAGPPPNWHLGDHLRSCPS